MTRTFHSSRSYRPSYSLLGRAVRAWVGDRLRGEALFIVVLTGLTLALLMGHYLGWALLQPVLTENPTWQTWFWGGQVASVLLLAGIGLLGFQPGVRVTCTPSALTLTQGSRSRTLPLDSIREADLVSARQYHRHYRHYAAPQVFVSAVPDEVLLLRTEEGLVIVGLDAEAHAALIEHLQTDPTTVPEPVPSPPQNL